MPRFDRQPSHHSVKREPSPTVKREDSLDEVPNNDSDVDETEKSLQDDALTRDSPSMVAERLKTSRSPSSTTSSANMNDENSNTQIENGAADDHLSPKMESHPPQRSIRAGKKQVARIAPLFDCLPDATDEANSTYQVIDSCVYQNKFLGYTEHAMECDCAEEWDPVTKINAACGEDSDCINRATKMECVGDCGCGPACQNQRFWRRLYANVSVIKTEKKGYGLRANTALRPGDFIFEYIGEVIPEGTFRKRMRQYDNEGIKHFYFMSLSKGEFVDATKRGNLGRFCNHSCNPNCYVDKWVVGDKLRMGVFAERAVRPGEELVFNYNVDRYGAEPQPCYCGESNCTGFIGGKTQTERATKLSAATIEALGIEDDDWDAWDTVTAKKPKKKRTADDDDEDYVERVEMKGLDVDGVTKVMAALMQCKEKWIAVKLLERIQKCQDEDVLHRIIKLHGYRILNSQLSAWREDDNVILQILDILDKFPRLTRNKIVDAKIDKTLEPLRESSDDRVVEKSSSLLDQWSKLELAYRIPRKVRTANDSTSATPVRYERRDTQQLRRRSRSRSRSKSPPKGPSTTSIPTGPKAAGAGAGPRPFGFGRAPSVQLHRSKPPLPAGWSETADTATGRTYFYSAMGETSWTRPSKPAILPPPPKQSSQQDLLKSIINDIVTSKAPSKDGKTSTPDTPEVEQKKEKKGEKWRSLDEEKQKKIYETTLFPHISHVMNRYKHKIPKEDLKRFAKEIAKKLVSSDYKAGRVDDPTQISEKQQKKVKAFCKEYFDKAAAKHRKHEEERAARKAKKSATTDSTSTSTPMQSPAPAHLPPKKEDLSEDEDVKMPDVEDYTADPDGAPMQLKRKRSTGEDVDIKDEDDLTKSPMKKLNLDSEPQPATTPPPPPPPPEPPTDTPPETDTPEAHDFEPDLHADTNFKGKSMADVLAQAQQENDDDDDEVDWGVEDADVRGDGLKIQNPLVDEQSVS